jgi:hypothetical protein
MNADLHQSSVDFDTTMRYSQAKLYEMPIFRRYIFKTEFLKSFI